MKKLFLVVAILFAFVLQGMAQDTNSKIEQWKAALNLSVDQETQIKAAFAARKTKIDAARAVSPKDKAAIKAAKEEFRAKVKTILTPEQQAKLKEWKKNNKGKGRGKGKGKSKDKDKENDEDDDDLD